MYFSFEIILNFFLALLCSTFVVAPLFSLFETYGEGHDALM